jgi:catalase
MVVNGNGGAEPNYPSPLQPNMYRDVDTNQQHEIWTGQALYNLQPVTSEEYVQANWLWEVLGRTKGQQENLVHNVSVHLFAAVDEVRERTYEMFSRVNQSLGRRIRDATEEVRAAADAEKAKKAMLKRRTR